MSNVRRKLLIMLVLIATAVAVPAVSALADVRPGTISEMGPNVDKNVGPNSGEPDVGQTTPNAAKGTTLRGEGGDLIEWTRRAIWMWSMRVPRMGF